MVRFPLSGSAELAARINSFPWEHTALGPIEQWPSSLRTALSILLGSRFPMQILWGPDYIHFYNDAYLPIAADKHPRALGRPGAMIWPEIWGQVLPMLEQVRRSGEPSWSEDQLLLLERNGAVEESYFTFSYSPIRGDEAQIEGIFVAVTENSRRVLAERRLRTIRDLGAAIAGLTDEGAILRAGEAIIAQNQADIPCALCYTLDENQQSFRLSWACGLTAGHKAAPERLPLGASVQPAIWPPLSLPEVAAPRQPALAPPLALQGDETEPIIACLWEAPVTAALLLPLRAEGSDALAGWLMVGLSPRLHFGGEYAEFLERIATQLGAAIAAARGHALANLAVRVRDDFLSIAAHELKTPLTPLIARLELMARRAVRDALPERYPIDLARIVAEARRLSSLIDVLLDISRLRSGQLNVERAPVDLAQLARQILAEIEPSLTNHSLTLTCQAEPALLEGDALRLEQVLRNLLSNAVKYSPDGGAISVQITRQAHSITLSVRDQGIGIPADLLPLIFERYYRVSDPATAQMGGLGIGLFVVHEIVRLHGGAISVESEPGVGTCFTIVLPATSELLEPLTPLPDNGASG
jgi:signal transduction histidine kinase